MNPNALAERVPPRARGARRARCVLRLACTLALLLSAGARPCLAWGFSAHRLVNRRAIAALPPALRPLFEANADYVAEHAIDADLRRLSSSDPDHFLDLDAFGAYPFAAIPQEEAAHLARHGPEARDKGRLPWRLAEVYRELVAAFAARDAARILQRAAELGHFVGDAHVPLHAVLNYDGQLTGQDGLHNRWESELVERFERQLEAELRAPTAVRIADPVGFGFETLRASFTEAAGVLESDRACAGTRDLADTAEDERYDDAYYSRLYAREAARLRARLEASSSTLASLWQAAWLEAGQPAPPAGFRFPYVRRAARAVVVSLDGASTPLVDDALARGLMPSLARLRESGAWASGSLAALPTKTAASHAALYTGAWSDRNGIAGNELSAPDASILESGDGYSSLFLTAEPLWVAAARQGLEATVLSATQVYPFEPFTVDKRFGRNYGWRLTLFDGYQNLRAADAVYTTAELPLRPAEGWLPGLPRHDGTPRELALEAAGVRVDGLLYDDPGDPGRGLDTLLLTLDKDPAAGVTLKPRAAGSRGDPSAFAGLRVRLAGGEAALYFRLFELAPDGSALRLYRSAPHVLRSSRPRAEGAAFEATGGFLGNGASALYEAGAFGPPLWEGGDGTAERRYLETVGLVVRQFARLTSFGLERTSWDVLFTYLPYPDEALHLWLGRLDPTLPGHDAALAARLRPFLDQVLALCDEFLSGITRKAAERTVLAVVSDHGQAGTDRVVRPNVALAAAGLLAQDPAGRVDLGRTRAFYAPGGYILINRTSRPGGVVAPAQEEDARRAAARALTGVKDPESGAPVILAAPVPGRQDAQPAFGGATGGDLYLSLAPRYRVSSSLRGPVVEPVAPRGDHFANPERAGLHGIFLLAGEGVAAGAELGEVQHVDLAPTLCALLGIDPPANAVGRVLAGALARR
jgi:predicted AlkP superfamily phosphohydrolase/phosphomutase